MPPTILSALLSATLALAAPVALWSGTIAGAPARWTAQDLTVAAGPGHAAFSLAKFLRLTEDERNGFDAGTKVELSARLASAVGTVLSCQVNEFYMARQAAHPGSSVTFRAVDLARPKAAAHLGDYFPKPQVFQALMADKLVKQALNGEKPKDLDALAKALSGATVTVGEHLCAFDDDFLDRFAFHHVEGERVAVRLALGSGSGADRDAWAQVGVLLPIPAKLGFALQAAQQAGTLMTKLERLPEAATMRLEYTTTQARPGG